MVVEWDPGTQLGMHWWEQMGIDLVGGEKWQWRRWKWMGDNSDKGN